MKKTYIPDYKTYTTAELENEVHRLSGLNETEAKTSGMYPINVMMSGELEIHKASAKEILFAMMNLNERKAQFDKQKEASAMLGFNLSEEFLIDGSTYEEWLSDFQKRAAALIYEKAFKELHSRNKPNKSVAKK